VEKTVFLSHLYSKMLFYQDRLGTNIGKALKNGLLKPFIYLKMLFYQDRLGTNIYRESTPKKTVLLQGR
jgi:hypothetical protein